MSYEISVLEDKHVKHCKPKPKSQSQSTERASTTPRKTNEDSSVQSDADGPIYLYPRYIGPIYRVHWENLVPHRLRDVQPNKPADDDQATESETEFYGYHFPQRTWKFHFPEIKPESLWMNPLFDDESEDERPHHA
eukprot:CAMPEP_0197051206 /NCGR_PEP_ID=MMETSP1384-20130603/25928_1 /TAXON_ID=29189 /ORGANISM="Ammonia sp." /LENGTH=135 /DNA_ID=CAMNT_0042483727 /DNA_START=38 /DNA_END=445 /DNA_ORIENTATION=+